MSGSLEDRPIACSIAEAKALHELGVRNHGWYMTESEHRGVLDVLERLSSALEAIAKLKTPSGLSRETPSNAGAAALEPARRIARGALRDG